MKKKKGQMKRKKNKGVQGRIQRRYREERYKTAREPVMQAPKHFFQKCLLGACFVLFVGLIFMGVQNFNLKKEIKSLNENINTLSVAAVNDFSLFIMNKVSKCEAVTLMADDTSITINDVRCR